MKKKQIIAKEIKDQIIDRIKNQGVSVSQAAQEHGISTNTIYTWLSKKTEGGPGVLEVVKLKKENKELRELVGDYFPAVQIPKKDFIVRSGKLTKSKLSNLSGVSRQFLYYRHIQCEKDWNLKVKIEEVLHYFPSYGYRRVAKHLKMNRKPVQRVMKFFGLKAFRRRCRKPKKNNNKSAINYPNLLFQTMPAYPNHVWATDFTYLWFNDKFIYVCTVLDLFTRTVVGFSVSAKHDRWLVITAFLDALRHNPRPEILHSDHGKEYTSKDYDATVTELGITRSMSRPGCPWENGYQEGFYSQFKIDLGDPNRFSSLGELTAEIYRTIYVYNHTRIHSAFGTSPLQFAGQHIFAYN